MQGGGMDLLSNLALGLSVAVSFQNLLYALLGCMVGADPAKYSTVAQWETYLRASLAKWPRLGGAYIWESSRPGTAEWATRLGAVLAGA